MRGDTLIEVLIALAIAVVVISAITTLGISSLNNAKFVATQEQAAKYVQEGMEIVRNIRNSSYVGYASYDGDYCLRKNGTSLEPIGNCAAPNIDDTYIRTVTIDQNETVICGNNFAHTTVKVSWTDGKCSSGAYCHVREASSCLSTQPPIPGL